MGKVPTPALLTSKSAPATAVPEYVPPAGDPPARATDCASSQTSFTANVRATVGKSNIVNVTSVLGIAMQLLNGSLVSAKNV